MKKIFSAVMAAAMLTASTAVSAETDIKLYINGEELLTDPAAIVQNDRLMVPFRAIFEELGATVNWDAEMETIMAVRDSSVMILQVDTPTLFLNTEQIELDVAPIIVSDHAMVPVRAVSEAFGIDVEWDNDTREVNINF